MANENERSPQCSTLLKRLTLKYPKHAINPEDLLDFIELRCFSRRWEDLGLDDEGDLTSLQLFIMCDPKGPDIVPGTESIRKMRFAPSRWKFGKSGAARVLYVYFEEFGIVLLCMVWRKGEVESISAAVKNYLNRLVREVEKELRRKKSL